MKRRIKNWRIAFWKQCILFLALILNFPEANAAYDKICSLHFKEYTSPSLNGCVLYSNSEGNLSFKLQNKKVKPETCQKLLGLNSSQLSQFKNLAAEFKGAASEVVTLLAEEFDGTYTAEISGNSLLGQGLKFPSLQKKFSGFAEGTLDNGLHIQLNLAGKANLKISGDFGRVSFVGACTKYENNNSNQKITSKLNNAKMNCSDLGFKAGTEKHGDCVLKLLDH